MLPDPEIGGIVRYGDDAQPDRAGTVTFTGFTLDGQSFPAMDSARVHDAGFNEAISIMLVARTRASSTAAVMPCPWCRRRSGVGWLKDRYGLSWQIVPFAMGEMLASGTVEQIRGVTKAFLPMKKFDVAALQRAYEGTEAPIGG